MNLKGRIRKINLIEPLEVVFSLFKPYTAALQCRGFFSGIIHKLDVLYTFISAKLKIVIQLRFRPTTAPAETFEIDTAFREETDAQLLAQPAEEITIDQREKATVLMRLVSYKRAGIEFIKSLFVKKKFNLISAPGVGIKYTEALAVERKTDIDAVGSAIIESRYNEVKVGVDVSAETAPAVCGEAHWSVPVELETNVSTAESVDVGIEAENAVCCRFFMATWIDPVVVDGVLILRQAYSATQTEDNVLVVI